MTRYYISISGQPFKDVGEAYVYAFHESEDGWFRHCENVAGLTANGWARQVSWFAMARCVLRRTSRPIAYWGQFRLRTRIAFIFGRKARP